MGIKFDILSDIMALYEASELTRFFTGYEPVRKIHQELKLTADAEPEIQQTRNRHVIWDALRTGDAVLAVVHKPDNLKDARDRLKAVFSKPDDMDKKARSYNEIVVAVKQALRIAPEKATASYEDIKRIQRLFFGPEQTRDGDSGIVGNIKEVYSSTADEKIQELTTFITNVSETDRVLMKRISHAGSTKETAFQDPGSRNFPIAKKDPQTGKTLPGEKVTGQKYNIWFFSGDRFIRKETLEKNVTHVFRPQDRGGVEALGGWTRGTPQYQKAKRDFYIIKNVEFQATKRDVNDRIIHLNTDKKSDVLRFFDETANKFRPIIAKKAQEADAAMKQRASDMSSDPNVSENEAIRAMREYRQMLSAVSGTIDIDKEATFYDFIKKPDTDWNDIVIRDPGHGVTRDPLGPRVIKGPLPPRSMTYDPDELGSLPSHDLYSGDIQLEFGSQEAYNRFQRQFIIHLLRRLIKTSSTGALEDILSAF